MQNLSINANQGSQAYGNDVGGNVILGSIVRATVVEKLDDNLYLLQVGKNTIEAQVVAELQEGTEYQFVVQKGGNPPELALVQDGSQAKENNGLTPEENRWVGKLANLMGLPLSELDAKSLLQWVRVLGYDIQSSPEQVFQQLKPVLELMPAIDSAPPIIRQLMGHTLLFTMHQQQNQHLGNLWFEQAIRLSGQIPKWNEDESQWLVQLKQLIESLPEKEQTQIKSELLALKKAPSSILKTPEQLLPKIIETWVESTGKDISPEAKLSRTQNLIQSIQSDDTKRLFLSSQAMGDTASRTLGSLQRNEAIQAFQQQAPGLMSSDISNLLEQFSSLGGKLEKLSVGDVISAQLSWKGGTPSAMEVHRTGALLHLAQELPQDSRHFSSSDLISNAPKNQMPVVLDPSMVSDPSASSISMHKLKEFSQSSQLPNTFHVERLLQNWHQSGGALSELRGNLDSINQWNQFIESFPELRSVLAEHLLKAPAITSSHIQQELSPVPVSPETQQNLSAALRESGIAEGQIPKKEMAKVMQAIQQVAGEGNTPSKSLMAVATWMIGKGIEISPSSLKSLLQVQQGHSESKGLNMDLQKLIQWVNKNDAQLAGELKNTIADLNLKGTQIKDTLSFYQKGNGKALTQWLGRFQEHLSQNNMLRSDIAQIVQQLQGKLFSHEEFLSGLKHYNIQAQRQDTPQVFELPVSFGETVDHALIRIYKRQQGNQASSEDKNYKVVIDLDLDGVGKVRSEVTLINKHLQLDFLTPNHDMLGVLKSKSEQLKERLDANDLNASMGFKLKKVENDALMAEHKAMDAPKEKSNIDISA
jgi:hypothetical protein